MLQVNHINAKDEDLWNWFRYKQGDDDCLVRLKIITGPEIDAAPNDKVANKRYVAEHWFTDFKGIVDANKTPVPNTLENRAEILNHPSLWPFVSNKLYAASTFESEGKDVSGSAS